MEQVILRANNRRKTMQNLQGNHQTSPRTPFWRYRNVSLVLSPPTFSKGPPLVSLKKARFGGCDWTLIERNQCWDNDEQYEHIFFCQAIQRVCPQWVFIYEHLNIHEYPVCFKESQILRHGAQSARIITMEPGKTTDKGDSFFFWKIIMLYCIASSVSLEARFLEKQNSTSKKWDPLMVGHPWAALFLAPLLNSLPHDLCCLGWYLLPMDRSKTQQEGMKWNLWMINKMYWKK